MCGVWIQQINILIKQIKNSSEDHNRNLSLYNKSLGLFGTKSKVQYLKKLNNMSHTQEKNQWRPTQYDPEFGIVRRFTVAIITKDMKENKIIKNKKIANLGER